MKDLLPDRVRLGAFQVDLRAGEVRDGDRAMVLPEQAFQILRMLIERVGGIVTRQEIQKKLWPNDTVVEFDHSINAAINKLRQALGDSAAAPKYIETIARRGYRLTMLPEPVTDAPAIKNGNVDVQPAAVAAPPAVSPAKGASLIGKKVSHYRVAKVIGVGGMGLVYEAEDLKLGRAVALKFLPEDLARDEAALQRFEREARAASSLDHPNICTIYEVEEHEDEPFIVMQLLRGESLRDRLATLQATEQRLSLPEILDIALQICNGLAAAHTSGVIHRDIKPANIFLTTNGAVKILDFGVAKLMEAGESAQEAMAVAASPGGASSRGGHLTETGPTMGTAGYMSPEQVRGETLDARTDLFSFGLVLYEMAAGQRAFTGETAAAVKGAIQVSDPLPLRDRNGSVPPKLESIINRALEKDRERRYQSAADLRSDLRSLDEARPLSGDRQAGKPSLAKAPLLRWVAVAALGCVALMTAGFLYWRAHRAPKLTERDTIMLADFTNSTGDPVFDDTLRQALTAQLSQSPFFNVLSDRRIRGALKELNHPASELLTDDVARDVCRHTASKAMLTGSIGGFGKGYMLGLKAVDCNTRDVLAEAQERSVDKAAVLKALDEAAITIRRQMGEPLSSVRTYATPLAAEGATQSLEAWKAYTTGVKSQYKGGPVGSLPFLQRAVEIDPTFARAYASLAIVYSNLNEGQRSEEYARKAYELRDKVSQRERFAIEAVYYSGVMGDLDRAALTYALWQQNYQREAVPAANLAVIHARLGKHEQALELGREAMRIQPNHADIYNNLESSYQYLNRLEDAEELLRQAEHHGITDDALLQNWYQLAFLKGDSVQMAQKTAAGMGKPGIEDALLALQADTDGWYGRYKMARKVTQHAMDSAERNDAKETAAVYQVSAALREAAAGNWQQARFSALAALKVSQSREVKAMTALALALARDAATSEKLAGELDKVRPSDTMVQRYWLPTIRAAVALERKDSNRALEILNGMESLELADAAGMNVHLPSVYVRGQAYLMRGDGKAAAAEFRKFIDHYGLVVNFPWGALARLGLARAYALEAQTDPSARDKARTAYENFLTLWKDADPDIPIYKQAKTEYAKLK